MIWICAQGGLCGDGHFEICVDMRLKMFRTDDSGSVLKYVKYKKIIQFTNLIIVNSEKAYFLHRNPTYWYIHKSKKLSCCFETAETFL